jgi:multidrug efflux pump subunit AcrA (membrane-fusion protein)
MFRRRNIILNVLLVVVLAGIGFFGYRTLYPKAAVAVARTATVSVQDVSTTVSASGTVQPSLDVGVNFGTSGVVRTLNVKVGDKVRKGELLATTDDRSAKLALLQARISEQNAQTAITSAATNLIATDATDDQAITNAQNALAKLTAGPTAATLDSQAKAIASQQLAIENATATYNNALASQKQVEDNIALNLIAYNKVIDRAQYDWDQKCPTVLAMGLDCATNSFSRTQVLALQDAQQAKVVGVTKDNQSDAAAILSVDSARRSLLNAQAALDTLKSSQAVANQPALQSDIDTAKANIAAAQRTKVNADNAAAAQTGSLAGALETAKAQLANAQSTLDGTQLYAPVSATVAAVASAVGMNAGSTTAGSTGVTGFIVLTDLTGLQVTASFAEADIVSLQVGQQATVSFDAIANSSANGEVIAIAPLNNASTSGGSVTSYTVTFSLTGQPDGVKPGMTAQVSVMTAQSLGVLAVTSSALTQRGGNYTVTLAPTKVGVAGVRIPVTIGLKGDTLTEITSGLKEGDKVELRTTTGTSASSGFPAGGIPGGGGIGVAVRVGG